MPIDNEIFHAPATVVGSTSVGTVGTGKYRGLYQFDARNGDELSFLPGDVITVRQIYWDKFQV